jgi:two-component system, chemotaxis family, CheB/CheR fusion protein
LQSANEEILSSNEELQSTNEELDTAKEELQSSNEELNTVNEELHSRNDELSRVNSDLINLLATVDVTILIVGDDMRIRRFTPTAERILNLIPGDVGRPVGQINTNLVAENLESLTRDDRHP